MSKKARMAPLATKFMLSTIVGHECRLRICFLRWFTASNGQFRKLDANLHFREGLCIEILMNDKETSSIWSISHSM